MKNTIKLKLEQLQMIEQHLAPALAQRDKLKDEIRELVMLHGQNVKVDGVGKAEIKQGHSRVSYDTKGLDGFAVAFPAVLQFRKETLVKPTVAITLEK